MDEENNADAGGQDDDHGEDAHELDLGDIFNQVGSLAIQT